MDKRFVSVMVFAVVISATASYALYKLISAQMSFASREVPTHELVVASRELPIGTLLREDDLKVSGWSGAVPEGSFTKKDEIVGRGVVETIYSGEPVQAKRVAQQGAGAGLAATIPNGMRAVAVRVNEVVGVAGFVTPGMTVDVLIAGNPPNASTAQTGPLAKTLLQNIKVLSAGQNIQKDAEGKPITVPVVNLLVTPEQAEILSLASNETRIQLVLRNPLDREVTQTPGSAVASLFSGVKPKPTEVASPSEPSKGEVKVPVRRTVRPSAPAPVPVTTVVEPPPPPPPPPVVKAPPPPITIEVIHGSKRSESKFQREIEVTESKQ